MSRILLARVYGAGCRAWRVLLPWARCHASPRGGCTELGVIAAQTYGLAALPVLGLLAEGCYHEHHDR
jgi:hypothetical protein